MAKLETDVSLEPGTELVRLGAICEWSPEQSSAMGASFGIVEFADLADGERWTLHDDRGWGSSGTHRYAARSATGEPTAPLVHATSYWESATVDSIVSGMYTTLLPDEDDIDNHDWIRLVGLLAERGLTTFVDEIRQLPYIVEFGPKLLAKLRPAESARLPMEVDWAQIDRANH